ncbi:hypothetical protein LA345_36635 (plasmid) [Burkholderia vietnamiensis]|uniref:Uncharacterized protein n=1 Tax=Burkholderia vietnamiensis (strain G4 / LMG 22486) TaxID=269482 RepID=A4JVU8_BURVG|nr:hypothetical protein Bcep1808_7526 [Burkholderia vietnamiensis G4]MCB4349340.1 hypothetical protein [Burkholderia vietnamiensis]
MNHQRLVRATAVALTMGLSVVGPALAQSVRDSGITSPHEKTAGNTVGVSASTAPSPKNAFYAVTMRRGKSVTQTSVSAIIGAAATAGFRTSAPDATCTFKSALGTSTLQIAQGDDVSLTIVPAEEKDGAVATIIRATTSQAPQTPSKIIAGCPLFAGETKSEGWLDASTLRVGQEMNARFGDTQISVRLTSLAD